MNIKQVWIEKEIVVDEIGVRGYADLIVLFDNGQVHLFDIKTMGSYQYRLKFGRNKSPNPSIHQELQLATYAIGIKEWLGRIDGIWICAYNKDNSYINYYDIDLDMMYAARNFWKRVGQQHEVGLPYKEKGTSPVMEWECKYCNFLDRCDNDERNGK